MLNLQYIYRSFLCIDIQIELIQTVIIFKILFVICNKSVNEPEGYFYTYYMYIQSFLKYAPMSYPDALDLSFIYYHNLFVNQRRLWRDCPKCSDSSKFCLSCVQKSVQN